MAPSHIHTYLSALFNVEELAPAAKLAETLVPPQKALLFRRIATANWQHLKGANLRHGVASKLNIIVIIVDDDAR